MLKPKLNLEIANLMDYELAKTANNHDFSDLNQAVDYLNSAIDVLENSGFTTHADALLNVLQKIASFEKSKALMQMPSLQFYQETAALGFDIYRILRLTKSKSEMIANQNKAILNNLVRSEGSKIRIAAILNKNVEDLNEEDFKKILEDNYLEKNKAGEYLFSLPNLREHLNFDITIYTIKKDYFIDDNSKKYQKTHYVYVCKKKPDAEVFAENFEKVYYEIEKQEIEEMYEDEEQEYSDEKNII